MKERFARLKVLFCLVLLSMAWEYSAATAVAQTTYTWGNNAGTAWATGSNWVGGTPAGSNSDSFNNDIAQWNSGSTGSTIQLNFNNLGTPYYLGTLQTVTDAVTKTLGSNTNTSGILQLNGTGINNLIIDHQSTNGFTIAPQAGGGTGPLTLRLNAVNNTINNVGALAISANIMGNGNNDGITKTGAGTLTLSGANTFTGGVTVNGGAVNFTGDSAFGTGTITFGTGVVSAAGFAGSPSTAFLNNTSSANTTLANNIVLASPITNTTYTVQKAGSGGQLNLTGDISGGSANTKLFLQTSTAGDNTTTFRFAGNNTFQAGQIEIWRGALVVGSINGLGNSSNLIRMNGNNNTSLGDLRFEVSGTYANSIQAVINSAPIGVGNNDITLSGVVFGNGINKLGAGNLILTNANTYTNTTITAGTVQVGNGGTTGTLGTGTVSVGLGGTLAFNRSNALTVSNAIAGAGAVNQIGSGTTTLSGANTFTGPLNINAGTLALDMTGSLTTNAINVASGGVYDVSNVFGYNLGSSQTLTIGRSGTPGADAIGDFNIAGNVNVGGTGIFRTATFANNLTLNSGTVAFDLADTTTIGNGINDLVSVGGNLNLLGTNNIAVTAVNGLTNGTYTLFNYGGTLFGNSSNLSLSGISAGTTRQTFAFDVGTGTNSAVTLAVSGSAANLAWTGSNGGIWDLVNTSGNFSGDPDNRFYNLDNVSFTGGAPIVNLVGSLAPGSVTVDSAGDFTFTGTGSIVGTASLVKSGTGSLTIETSNTYSGGTTINGGTLRVGNGGTTGSITGNVINNSNLAINRSDSVNFSNVISGSGDVTLLGGGTYTLNNGNTYTGSTTVSNSTLNLTSDNILGVAPGVATAGHLNLNSATVNNATAVTLDANRGIDLTGSVTLNTTGALSYNGVITGSGGLVKGGASTLTLGGASTFSGGVTHSGGTITVNDASGLGTGTFTWGTYSRLNMAVADGQTWDLANNFVLPDAGGASTLLRIGDGSPTAGTTLRLTGVLSGGTTGQNYRIVDSDQGGNHNHVLILDNANNTMSGTLEMWRGTLAITSDGALGNVSRIRHYTENLGGSFRFDADNITVAATREFQLVNGSNPINTQANTATIAGNIFGSGSLVKQGSGTLILTGDNTNTGAVTVSQGTLLVNNTTGSGTGTGSVTVASGATLGGAGIIAGPVTVNGTLAPGASIESLDTGAVTFNSGSFFAYELDTANFVASFAGDLLNVAGDLTLNDDVNLILTDLALSSSQVAIGSKLTLVSYSGDWNGVTFVGYADGSQFSLGNNLWAINYADTMAGINGGSYSNFVTLTAVPEPSSLLFFGITAGLLTLHRRRR